MKKSVTLVVLAGVASAALVGCGSPQPAISASASATLVQQVEAVRGAAASHDVAGARAWLAQLRATVAELQRTGQISAARAAAVVASATEVDAQLGSATTSTSTPPPTTAETSPPPPGKGKAKGQGQGQGQD